ncbi:MAG: hypothetical protein EZS28_015053 [Streblomastix strix]|uniref:Tyr recombinase domain-containing protein n=1 Tax=Streblomastix strix TaxID=222440 RepID=A0A5J4W352_9EUKA|nr:MAG: hypothetical protein EZS28_015053 [Streblomastix strix]
MESRARYDVIWNLDRLLDYIEVTKFRSLYEGQLHAMSLLAIFSVARMTEFSRIQLSDQNYKWIDTRISVKQVGDSVFWNFNKSKPASSTYCCQSLISLLSNAGTQQPYYGPSIRHASMTKLRASGASNMQVNAFSRQIITSNVEDAFYYRPTHRDLGSLLKNVKRVEPVCDGLSGTKPRRMVGIVNNPAVNNGLYSPKDQFQSTDAADELATFQKITSTTSESADNRDSEER